MRKSTTYYFPLQFQWEVKAPREYKLYTSQNVETNADKITSKSFSKQIWRRQ